MKRKIINFINYKYFPYLIILLFSSLLIITFGTSYIEGDDSFFHISNIEVIKENLFHLSKIRPIIANNYGYGVGIFYPQLPHIFAGVIAYIVSDTILAMKLTKYIVTILSGVMMYIYVNKVFNDRSKSLIASISYITSSYFIVDMFYRDAFNESFMFLFMPMVFLGLHYLFEENNKKRFLIFFTLGYTLSIYSHLVLSVWFTIYVVIYLLFNFKKVFNKNIIYFIISSILILIFTSTYTIPLVKHMMDGSYYISSVEYDALSIWRLSIFDYIGRILWGTTKAYLFVNLSYVTIVSIVLTIIKLFRSNEYRKYLISFLFLSILGMIFSISLTILKILPNFLLNIQFAWRNVTFVIFFITVFSVDGLSYLYNKFNDRRYIPSLILLIVLLIHMFISLDKVELIDEFNYDMSTEGMGYETEYLPVETIDKDYIKNREYGLVGKVNYGIIKDEVPYLEFMLKDIKEEIEIELPRIYYLGYKITNNNGHTFDYYESENGFISFKIDENGTYELEYEDTNLIVSIIKYFTISIFIVYIIKTKE